MKLRVLFFQLLFFAIVTSVASQNVVLQPPKGFDRDNGRWTLKLMFKNTAEARFDFSQNLSGTGSKLLIGRNPNEYNVAALDVSGTNVVITPNQTGLNLATGRYYARVTNSSFRTFSEISNDPRAGLLFSNEVLLVIEAGTAPRVIAPRGDIDDGVPTFVWEAVSGVPAYWLLFSSTPFDISTNEDDDIEIKGANIVWQIITKNSSAQYGEINPDVAYNDQDAPPLNPGQEYSFAVLNVYEENNPVYASAVFGGIIPMRYNNPNALDRPTLISPEPSQLFQASENITFSWTEIDGANSYGVNLYQVITQQGVDATIPIWSTTTTNTIIDYPARLNLKSGSYNWNVVAFDGEGGGTTSGTTISPTRVFVYKIDNGKFDVSATSSQDGGSLTGVEVTIRAIQGGATPPIPTLLQAGSISDSLVVGTYEFTGAKSGFAETKVTATITKGRTTFVRLQMTPLPSFVEGVVQDEAGALVSIARIRATNLETQEVSETDTDSRGVFSIPLEAGNYRMSFSKAGYQSPSRRTISVANNQNFTLSPNPVLTNDRARISGLIVNENGGAIQNARVVATRGEQRFEVRTDASGSYSLTLTSGVWTISVTRSGFVPSTPTDIEFVVGDNLQGRNITLAGRANTITGFIREQLIQNGSVVGESPFQNVTITATPSAGSPVTTTSNSSGQFTLNLASGTFTLTVSRNGFRSITDPISLVMGFGETHSNVNFLLVRNQSTVTGTVRTPDGAGLSNAIVSIPNVGNVETGNSGVFSLSVPVGEHTVSATRSGYVASSPQTIAVQENQTLSGVNFVLSANAAVLSGTVVSRGNIVTGATVTATSAVFGSVNVLTDNRGQFTLNLRPSTWSVVASRSGFNPSSASSSTLGAGQRLTNLQLNITPNTRVISGTVTTAGVPLRNADIRILRPGNESFEISTRSQSNGFFSVSVEGGVSYSMVVSSPGYRSFSKELGVVAASETALIENASLRANPASVSGRVTDQNGVNLDRVRIVAIRTSDNVRVDSVTTTVNGTYSLGLPAGAYRLRSVRRGYSTATLDVTLQLGQNVENVAFNMNENFAFISGTVADGQGNPLENVNVRLSSNTSVGVGASATTSQSGTYSIRRIIGTNYTLSFALNGYSDFVNSNVAITDGQQRTINATLLAQQGSIEGRVLDVNNNPVPQASVLAVKGEGDLFQTTSDNAGNYSFTGIDLVAYTIQAQKVGFNAPSTLSVSLTPDQSVATNQVIDDLVPNNAVIRGTVTISGDNTPLSGANVSLEGASGSGSAITAPNGTYSIDNLAPGTYTITISNSGFSSSTNTVTPTAQNPNITQNVALLRDSGRLTGRVLNQQAQALDFRADLRLVSETVSYTTRSNADGTFTFNEIKTGESYTLSTQIFRDGHQNTTRAVVYPLGQASLALQSPLTVQVNNSAINGNAGEQGVAVRLLNLSTDPVTTVGIQISEPDGSYRFRNLAAGNYRLEPTLQGYIFTPAQSAQTLAINQTREVNFSAQANIGTITVNTIQAGQPVSGVSVSVVSTDTVVVLNGISNLQGQATFASVPAGKQYIIRASLEGFSATSNNSNVSVAPSANVVSTFTLASNNAALRGRVTQSGSGAAISEVNVRARLTSTGQAFAQETAANGNYAFTSIAPGIYDVIFSKSGFQSDTLKSVSLSNGQNLTGQDIQLTPTSLRLLTGSVTFGNAGVENAEVVLASSVSFTTTTNQNGAFSFTSVPLLTGANDTTKYTITVSTSDFSSTRTLQFTTADLGGTRNLEAFNLPSGQINLTITDGVSPLQGAAVQFVRSGGSNIVSFTTAIDGKFTSSNRLRASEYAVTVSRDGRLSPSRSILLALETDNSTLDREIQLPYVFEELQEVSATENAEVVVSFTENYSPDIASAQLFFKRASAPLFTAADMVLVDGEIKGEIVANNDIEDINYYVEVTDNANGITYSSPEYTITPIASGLVTRLRISPSIDGQVLRSDDIYTLELTILDGINESLATDFVGDEATGDVTFSIRDEAPEIEITKISNLSYNLSASEEGTYSVRFTAQLGGIAVSRQIEFEVSQVPVGSLTVSRPATRITNREPSNFTYSAQDTSGRRVFFGNSAQWEVIPPQRGTISSIGVFTPANDATIGSFTVQLTDPVSGISARSRTVDLFAVLNANVDNQVTNGAGFVLTLPSGTLPQNAEITLSPQSPENTKKYIYPSGSDISYTVSDQAYRISASIAEIGEGAIISIPTDSTLQFFDGEKVLARYNQEKLEWEILDPATAVKSLSKTNSQSSTQSFVSSLISGTGFIRFGQFAVLSQNDPLAIRHASALPNPFSPMVGPVKIGYALSSDAPPASVTITIFNVRGERIRTLLENDLQFPGRVGSRTSQKEITWDGLTDSGAQAMNGRYIVQITAKDANKETSKLLQIILVK